MKKNTLKRPGIVLFSIIIVALNLLVTVLKFTSPLKFSLSLQYFGPVLTYLDYGIDALLFLGCIYIEYGLYNAKQWAWKAIFWLYGIYLAGKVFGFIFGLIMYDKVMEMASILKFGELGHTLPFEMMLIGSIVTLVINGLIAFFILRAHYRVKNYFYK